MKLIKGLLQNSKKSVGRTINTFVLNENLYTVMEVLNYRFIKWTYLAILLVH